MTHPWLTRETLLEKAKELGNESAWEDFTQQYEKFIFYLLYKMNVKRQDIDDLSQTILVKIWSNLEKYDPLKGRFRSWLSAIIRNSVLTHFEKVKRRQTREKDLEQSEELEWVTPTTPSDLDLKIEEEWKRYVTQLAFERLQPFFSKNAMAVFAMKIEGKSYPEIATSLHIKEKSAIELNARVRSRYIDEVKKLIHEMES